MKKKDVGFSILRHKQQIHNRIIHDVFKWSMIVFISTVIIQFFRIVDTGFQPIMLLLFANTLVVIICVIFRNRLSYLFRTVTYITLFFIMGIAAIFNYGLIGGGAWCLILFTALSILLLHKKVYNRLIFGAALVMLICAIFYINRVLTFKFDILAYVYSPFCWFASVIGITFVLLLISKSIERVKSYLFHNQTELLEKNQSLSELTKKLEEEIEIRKQTEQNLIKEKEFTNTALNALSDIFLVFDPITRKAIKWNKAQENITGYNYDEVASIKMPDSYFDKQDIQLATSAINTAFREGSAKVELNLVCKNGDRIPYEFSGSYVLGDSGKPQNLIVIGRDISEQKNAERALRKSEKKYKALFTLAGDTVFIMQGSKIIDCNIKTEELLDCTRSEIIGLSPWDFSPEYQPDGKNSRKHIEEIVKSWTKGNSISFQWQHKKFNGELFDAEISINSIDLKIGIFVVILRDITDIKQLHRRIYNARVEAEEKERERFARELHDGLGPMLSAIKFNYEWLNDTIYEAKRIRMIEMGNSVIEEAFVTLKEISNNLNPHILINFGLFEAIESFISKISENISAKIKFNTNYNKRLESELEITLYRIVQELLNNTIKYAKANIITIDLDEDIEFDIISLRYTDNGIGFNSQEVLDSKKGYGLFNIYNRVILLGGSILINSAKGKGMEVKISLNMT